MRMHKGNLYQKEAQYTIQRNIYLKDLLLYFKRILLFSLFIYLAGESAVGFALLYIFQNPHKAPKISPSLPIFMSSL